MTKFLLLLILPILLGSCSRPPEAVSEDLSEGRYTSHCIAGSTGSYAKTSSIYAGGFNSEETSISNSADCSSPSITFSVERSYVLSGNDGANGKIDLTLMQYKLTPNTPEVVTAYNATHLCGYYDWALNVPKDVAARICGNEYMPLPGVKTYSIYFLLNESLQLGTSDPVHSGTTEELRHVNLTDISQNHD